MIFSWVPNQRWSWVESNFLHRHRRLRRWCSSCCSCQRRRLPHTLLLFLLGHHSVRSLPPVNQRIASSWSARSSPLFVGFRISCVWRLLLPTKTFGPDLQRKYSLQKTDETKTPRGQKLSLFWRPQPASRLKIFRLRCCLSINKCLKRWAGFPVPLTDKVVWYWLATSLIPKWILPVRWCIHHQPTC